MTNETGNTDMTPHSRDRADAGDDLFIIGRGIGPVGRWLRLLLGLYFLTFLVLNPLYLHPVPHDEIAAVALIVGAYTLLITGIYFAVFYLIGGMFLARMNPWAGTVIFLGIPMNLALLGLLPQQAEMAFWLYLSGSLVVAFFMRYGGCEAVALPSLLLKRRFTMYCPFNAVDTVERAVTPDESMARHRHLTISSLAIVIFVGGYFFLVEWQVLGHEGIAVDIDNRWSLLLLVPLIHLVALTLGHYRSGRDLLAPKVRRFGLGAAVLALAIVAFLFDGVTDDALWFGAMGLGGLFVVLQSGTLLARRLTGWSRN